LKEKVFFLFLKTGSGRPDDIIKVTKKTMVFKGLLFHIYGHRTADAKKKHQYH